MNEDKGTDQQPKLDYSKLLGFRNLIPVTKPESDIRESSELVFNKKGNESVA